MVKIRLRRMGSKKNPFYRIVVADSRYPATAALSRRLAPTILCRSPLPLRWMPSVRRLGQNRRSPTETVKALLKKANAI